MPEQDVQPRKSLIIVAMIEPWTHAVDPGTEIWCINRAYVQQRNPKPTRVFFFDDLRHFEYVSKNPDGTDKIEKRTFVEELNQLDCPVYTKRMIPEIKNCVEYPLDAVLESVAGVQFATCTVAYVLMMAIHEGFTDIKMHGMYYYGDSWEYWNHVICVNFWCGVAFGRGSNIAMTGETALCRPYPWQPPLYGYFEQGSEALTIHTMAAAYRACCEYPQQHRPSPEMPAEGPEAYKRIRAEILGEAKKLEEKVGPVDGNKIIEMTEKQYDEVLSETK